MPDWRWWISYTPGESGRWVAWATERPAPPNASVRTMLTLPGEAHFAFGRTVEEARANLEAELPHA